MDIRDSFFISDLKMKIERKLEVYNPNLVSHLSKQLYDECLIKLKIYNEVLEVLESDGITQGKIETFFCTKLNLTNNLIENARNEEEIKRYSLIIEEYQNLIKLAGDPLGNK